MSNEDWVDRASSREDAPAVKTEAFAKSQDKLALLAKEALTEFKEGKTKLIEENCDFSHN